MDWVIPFVLATQSKHVLTPFADNAEHGAGKCIFPTFVRLGGAPWTPKAIAKVDKHLGLVSYVAPTPSR
jgi:hypothetical protein